VAGSSDRRGRINIVTCRLKVQVPWASSRTVWGFSLPDTFGEDELEAWIPWLWRRHRDRMNHRRQLFQAMDNFAEEGLLQQRPEDECTDSEAEAALSDGHLGCPSPGDLNNGLNRTVVN
jgi:hypothetical protein